MAFLIGKNGVAFLIGKTRCGVVSWEDTMQRCQLGRHDAALSVKTESDAVFLIRMAGELYVGFNYK